MFLSQGKHRAASSSLEQALSFNFRVGKNPIFLLVKGSVLKEEGKLQEALETFEEALRCAGSAWNGPLRLYYSLKHRAIFFVFVVEVLRGICV